MQYGTFMAIGLLQARMEVVVTVIFTVCKRDLAGIPSMNRMLHITG